MDGVDTWIALVFVGIIGVLSWVGLRDRQRDLFGRRQMVSLGPRLSAPQKRAARDHIGRRPFGRRADGDCRSRSFLGGLDPIGTGKSR